MFQNIRKDDYEEENDNQYEDVEQKKWVKVLKQIFKVQNIFIYIISFAISTVGFGPTIAPFGLAIFAALCSNSIPIGITYILTLIGTYIGFGNDIFLLYLLTTLVFLVSIIIVKPKIRNEYKNNQKRLGLHIFLFTLIVQTGALLFKEFILYDFLSTIMLSIITYIFYKIFTNSIIVITEYGKKSAFTIEEVVGVSLLLTITASSLKNISIYGFGITNILSIFIILVLGWKNGILVGATSGITIGTILGIISGSEPALIASFALSGMIGGIFNRFGKIGVIIGFILGNAALTFASSGNGMQIIHIREILIASLGLLLVPKTIIIDIEEFFGKTKLLPNGNDRVLEENKETIYKLNNISQTISEIAKNYCGVAATTIEEIDDLTKDKKLFLEELLNRLENAQQNLLYEDLIQEDNPIIEDVFNTMIQKDRITVKELTDIFANYNNYIIVADEEQNEIIKDVDEIVSIINQTYQVCKINFIYKKKIEENKKNIGNQLNGVSRAISSVAKELTDDLKSPIDEKEKRKIETLLKQLEIDLGDIKLKKETSGKYKIDLYINSCESTNEKCDTEKIAKILSKTLNTKIINKKTQCGVKENKNICKQIYISEDKMNLQIGLAKTTKNNNIVSGDSAIYTQLEDGKYLVALSDGMGSGPEARTSSKIATKMLERLLSSGFDKDASIELINSSINLSSSKDTYASLDIAILDLFGQTIEFIKNGACPTYIKNKNNIELIKTLALPAGILNHIDSVVFERQIKENDILVMCTDGILDSKLELEDDQDWVKDVLSKINTNNVQKIADIILAEAIDNGYGIAKDDMTVIVCKMSSKENK